MKFFKCDIEGLYVIHPNLFEDNRGKFMRSFCIEELNNMGIKFSVQQGNISENYQALTMRGFHFQKGNTKETKLLTCVNGSIYNVVIDLRKKSQTYLKSFSTQIDSKNRRSILVPGGCANAFLTLKDNTIVHYYMNDYFRPSTYSGFRYNDPFFLIKWPHEPKFISEKDLNFLDFDNEKI